MQLQESGEMYLETILILSKKIEKVRSLDIAEYMNFSKPSVSRAVGILKDNGYITIASDGQIALSNSGKEIAERIYERHLIITDALISLGIHREQAEKDACKIEHDLSDETFNAIKSHIQKIKAKQ